MIAQDLVNRVITILWWCGLTALAVAFVVVVWRVL